MLSFMMQLFPFDERFDNSDEQCDRAESDEAAGF